MAVSSKMTFRLSIPYLDDTACRGFYRNAHQQDDGQSIDDEYGHHSDDCRLRGQRAVPLLRTSVQGLERLGC